MFGGECGDDDGEAGDDVDDCADDAGPQQSAGVAGLQVLQRVPSLWLRDVDADQEVEDAKPAVKCIQGQGEAITRP